MEEDSGCQKSGDGQKSQVADFSQEKGREEGTVSESPGFGHAPGQGF